jgi:PIN domain nuclease of toxin-antitoxin system
VILLDTSTLLWTVGEPERLSAKAREAISTALSAGQLCVSVASYWEIIIKAHKDQLKIADPVSWWNRATQLLGTKVLPIWASHVGAITALPDIHRDPFDMGWPPAKQGDRLGPHRRRAPQKLTEVQEEGTLG